MSWARPLKGLATRLAGGKTPVRGVGVSCPGALHPVTGWIHGRTGALNLPAWGEFNIRTELSDRTGLEVRAINDAKAMALGALARMTTDTVAVDESSPAETPRERDPATFDEPVRTFIEMDPGTGLGGAYVKDGAVWFGADPDAPDPDVGEIWKLTADPKRPEARLEELTCGRATLARVEKALKAEGGAEAATLLAASKGRLQEMLSEASPTLKPFIERELIETGRGLGLGMRYMMTHERKRLSAPDIRTFVIGGGMVSSRRPAAMRLRRRVHDGIVGVIRDDKPEVRVLFTVLGGKAGLYGSAALVK